MNRIRVSGPLTIPDLRAAVIGRRADCSAGVLTGLSAVETARVVYYHRATTGQEPLSRDGGLECLAPEANLPEAVLCHAARDIMEQWSAVPWQAARARRSSILVRAASRLRAVTQAAPAILRHDGKPGDLALQARRQPYGQFFSVEEFDIGWRRFDGQMSPAATRAVFVSGDAATVLPYDPVRDRVLVVEQFRAGPYARGDGQPWQIEAIAGRIDPGETPEQAARREAQEEAGLDLGEMRFVAGYYPSPGALSEYIYSYVALTDLPDDAAGVFGLAEEHEDIRGHVLGFDQLLTLIERGEVSNSPLILTAWWLAARRRGLRDEAR